MTDVKRIPFMKYRKVTFVASVALVLISLASLAFQSLNFGLDFTGGTLIQVAYEQPARWRFLLPRRTREADSPTDAYRRLFHENGLPEDSFERKDLRLYRLRMQTVSIDQGLAGSKRARGSSGGDD